MTADWGPGAYVGVHVFRPGGADGKTAPARAIGLTWVALDPTPRTLPLSITTDAIYRPRTTATFTVHTTPGAWVTLAAVDEGILSLTNFQTPDPLGHFFGQRTLGVGIHDDWARLLPPAGVANTMLRQGAGGDDDTQSNPIPQTIVSLFAGPVQAGPDGVAQFPLALPDFDGTLRLMAVGWDGAKTASAARDITMRDPLIVEPLLPRFLAPGDQARIGVMLQNLELPVGQVSVHLSASGTLGLSGGDPAPVTLAKEQRLVLPVGLMANGTGPGTLTVEADGPSGFHVTHGRGDLGACGARHDRPGYAADLGAGRHTELRAGWERLRARELEGQCQLRSWRPLRRVGAGSGRCRPIHWTASNSSRAAACRWRCCYRAMSPGRIAPGGWSRQPRRCSTGNVTTAPSDCGPRRATPSPG